jgi:hypothetical protein
MRDVETATWRSGVPASTPGRRRMRSRPTRPVSGLALLLTLAALGACRTLEEPGDSTAPPPPPAASVAVLPESVSLEPGASLQLTAVVRDSAGNVLAGRRVAWTSADTAIARVDSTGLVTALAPGTTAVTATSEGVSGSATVTVAAPAPGRVVIFADDFETGDLSRWDEYDPTKYSVTSDPARVRGGRFALQARMFPEDDWGELNKWYMPGYDEVYVEFDVLFEEGFRNLRNDGAGMHFVAQMGNRIDDRWSASGQAGIRPNGTDFFVTALDPEWRWNDPTLRPFMFYSYFPDMTCGSDGLCYGNEFRQSEPKTPLEAGRWYRIVFHVKANTPGAYDGGQTLWIDGQKKIEVRNMRWRDTRDLRLNQFSVWTYMPGAPQTQHIWIDNVVIWRPESP